MRSQLWVSHKDTTPDESQFEPVRNREYPWAKPKAGGLWTSTYLGPKRGSGWVQWCESEGGFGSPRNHPWWVLTPDADTRVLRINGLPDLLRVIEAFPHRVPDDELGSLRVCPDFEAIATVYDAIHLTDEGQWRTRLSMPHDLYGWDCESTLWLRWKFGRVRPLPPKPR